MSCMIVAECGVNFDGYRSRIPAFVQAAKRAGADACKWQAFSAKALIARRGITDPKTVSLLERCELSDADLDAIAKKCRGLKLKYFWSVFDPTQPKRVLDRGACAIKVAHAECDYKDLLAACFAELKDRKPERPFYVSEPDDGSKKFPFLSSYNVNIVTCRAEYPAKGDGALAILGTDECEWNGRGQRRRYSGFSSHWKDYHIPAASVLAGASYVECHLKLSDQDPEAAWSLSVEDFGKMVRQIREYESWL